MIVNETFQQSMDDGDYGRIVGSKGKSIFRSFNLCQSTILSMTEEN